jgi:hypothetical protein
MITREIVLKRIGELQQAAQSAKEQFDKIDGALAEMQLLLTVMDSKEAPSEVVAEETKQGD